MKNIPAFYRIERGGLQAVLCNVGASLASLCVPDAVGCIADVVLGFGEPTQYLHNSAKLGATVGRCANRIAGARFQLNGKTIFLTPNENGNSLHSGPDGYDSRIWQAEKLTDGVRFSLTSPDGDQGFPGRLMIAVTYAVTDEHTLQITYEGVCNADTVVNLTNHSYFNLAGQAAGPDVRHLLQLNADSYTPVDGASIPTGEIAPVAGTNFDFTVEKEIECNVDYDQNFVLHNAEHSAAAVLTEPLSGRRLTLFTSCPGLQFYSGNFLAEVKLPGKDGTRYRKHGGLCLETQFFPNAVNQPGFRSPLLRAGVPYRSITIWRFDTI